MKYIYLLILISAVVGVFILFIVPEYKTVQQMQADVDTYNASLVTATKLKQSREALVTKYNSISKVDLDNIQTLLPDSVNNIKLIIQIDSLATKNGLTALSGVNYNSDQTKDDKSTAGSAASASKSPYGEFTMTFSTSGPYQNFLSFISDIEQSLRIVDITSISFSSADGQSKDQQGPQYKVAIKTYWLK